MPVAEDYIFEYKMKEVKYTSWPLGQVPKELQRPELDRLKELGYNWSDQEML
jgi:hypothetical protein